MSVAEAESLSAKGAELKALLFPSSDESDEAVKDEEFLQHEETLAQLLADIARTCEASEEAQRTLGNLTIVRLLCGVLDRASSPPRLVHAALAAWMKILRRSTLTKATTCWENCDLSEEHIISLVPCMRARVADEVVAHFGSCMVMMLASDSDSRQFKFGLIGTHKVIISILKLHGQNHQVMEMALRAARNLSSLEQVACAFAQNGAGVALRDILLDDTQPQHVVEAALYATINVSFDAENATLLGNEGVCEALLDCATKWLHQGAVILELCWALRNLSAVDENTTKFSALPSACPLLLDLLRVCEDAEELAMALWGTANLCCDRNFAEQMLGNGGLAVLERTFRFGLAAFPQDAALGPVAEANSFAIYNMASAFASQVEAGEVDAGKRSKEALGQQGGCSLICAILERYADREAMSESCSRSIHALANDSVLNQTSLCEHGALPSLCRAAWTHRAVPETVFLAWKALLTVCAKDNAASRAALGAQGSPQFLEQVAALVHHYREIDEIVILGCSILLLLPHFTLDKKAQLRSGQFIDDEDKIVVKEDREAMLGAFEIPAIVASCRLTVVEPPPAESVAATAITITAD